MSRPASSAAIIRAAPVSRFFTVTLAPAKAPPVRSVMVPEIEAPICPHKGLPSPSPINKRKASFQMLRLPCRHRLFRAFIEISRKLVCAGYFAVMRGCVSACAHRKLDLVGGKQTNGVAQQQQRRAGLREGETPEVCISCAISSCTDRVRTFVVSVNAAFRMVRIRTFNHFRGMVRIIPPERMSLRCAPRPEWLGPPALDEWPAKKTHS